MRLKAELRAEGYPTETDRLKSCADEVKRYRRLFEREIAHHDITQRAKEKLANKVMDLTKRNVELEKESGKLDRLAIALLRENGDI